MFRTQTGTLDYVGTWFVKLTPHHSVWVFLLLGVEAIRTYKANPFLTIATWQIPTWTMPLVMVVVVSALIPGTSLIGHVCSLAVGYLCKLPLLPG